MRENELYAAHDENEKGTWEILGEDPNCGLGGYHHSPRLGIVTGKYGDVVVHALSLPGFFQWGSGGEINKLESIRVDCVINKKRKELIEQRDKLQAELDNIKKELKNG